MNTDGPYREQRPWGEFLEFIRNKPCTVKIITVYPGEAFSLQYHENRSEQWYTISGHGTVQHGDTVQDVSPGNFITIPPLTRHRVTAHSEPVVFLEISTGTFDENDITRLEDRYGRV